MFMRTAATDDLVVPSLALRGWHAAWAIGTGEAYDAHTGCCERAGLRPLTGRAVGDLIGELDMACLVRSRVISKGRYGRTREIVLDLPAEVMGRMYEAILLHFEMAPLEPARAPASSVRLVKRAPAHQVKLLG